MYKVAVNALGGCYLGDVTDGAQFGPEKLEALIAKRFLIPLGDSAAKAEEPKADSEPTKRKEKK